MSPRIAPAAAPYTDGVQEDFDKIMPAGMEPLGLFRTLAKSPRLLRRMRRGGLLDRGNVSVRQREIVILRTTALNRAEYEWGVHAALFASAAQLDSDALYATVWLDSTAACWTSEEALLIRACDELHASSTLSDELFVSLRERFSEELLLEVLLLAGSYRMISYVVHGARLELEPFAVRFPGEHTRDADAVETASVGRGTTVASEVSERA